MNVNSNPGNPYERLETAALRAYRRGIQTGSGGNLSARFGERMIVKSSGGSFADCNSRGAGFVETDFWGNMAPGQKGKPTREVFLHGLMYRISGHIGGVMHCHSPWAVAWSYSRSSLPMTTLHMQLKMGCDIPVLDIPSACVRPEDEAVVAGLFTENPNLPAFILAGHGVVALGRDVLEAEHNAELVEETAQIALLRGICEKTGVY